jgi:hypothetical protein
MRSGWTDPPGTRRRNDNLAFVSLLGVYAAERLTVKSGTEDFGRPPVVTSGGQNADRDQAAANNEESGE